LAYAGAAKSSCGKTLNGRDENLQCHASAVEWLIKAEPVNLSGVAADEFD